MGDIEQLREVREKLKVIKLSDHKNWLKFIVDQIDFLIQKLESEIK